MYAEGRRYTICTETQQRRNLYGKNLIDLIHKANVNRLPGREGVSFAESGRV
jgi:hypothetical protein